MMTLKWLNFVASQPFYLIHFLLFFSYIPIRLSASAVLSPYRSSLLLRREIQAVVTYSVLNVVKIVRQESWEAFIGDALFFGKMFLAALALVIDYHLALWYTVAYLVTYVITQQPACDESGTLSQLTPLQLESLLTEGSTSRYWLVEFRALSTFTCISTSSFFPELSITYSNKHLSFGRVDLGLFPNAAETFGISLASLGQLPTYVLFENATEIKRFPEVDFGPKFFCPPITKKLLCQHFELDKHLLDYITAK